MGTLKTLFFTTVALLLGLNSALAQTVTNSYGESHSCGLRTAPHSFTAPKGTISYYDFVSNLGAYWKDGSPRFSYFDEGTNEYRGAPSVAFVLENFYSIEFGSTYRGIRGAVPFLIRAEECNDLKLRTADGKEQFIAQLTSHLRYLDYSDAKPENAADYLRDLGKPFLEALARDDGKILVIARPVAISTFSVGDRMQRLNLEFVIEDFRVLK